MRSVVVEVARLLEVHAQVDVGREGQAGVPAAVHHGVAAHHVEAAVGVHGHGGVVSGTEAGKRARGDARLLLEALILVAGLCGCLQVVIDGCAGRAGDGVGGTRLALEVCGRRLGQLAEVEELLVGVDALVRVGVEGRHRHRRVDCGSHGGVDVQWELVSEGKCSLGRRLRTMGCCVAGSCS